MTRRTILATALVAAFAGSGSALDDETAAGSSIALSEARPFFFALSVRDVDASSGWYQRLFGFTEARAIDLPERGLRIRLLRRAGAFLELGENAAVRDLSDLEPKLEKRHLLRGVFKIGFAVDDLDSARERLEELGIPLRGKVITEADGSMRSLQIEDPDGNVIQLFELLEAASE